ncbi:MAG: cytochrome c biogenesis protein CcsA, partial [Candidatus Thalassarchaeum sp.]|nr:cytochrome c biogenesis protein CcsA [Candidatus Thalassarchaeum sp.]
MLSLLGRALLALAFLTSAHQIARPEKAGDAVVRNVTMTSQIAPFALLVGAFVLDASSLDLVARFGGDGLPLFYRISAVWGGRAGPLLLWAAILAVVTWFMAREGGPAALEVRIMHVWVLALVVLAWLLEPFAAATGGQGELHPLLQTDLMVIHPPVVFSYYALCLATASVALAGVLRRDSADAIHAAQLHWARAGFVLGSIGIGLGGLWAYTVLDWGGYWAWDPVETGSLLPWLALLLIVHVRAKPDSSSAVSASPAIGLLAGALAFHATLVTRANGVWASVHAFVADGEGTLADDPYLRVLDIAELTPVGIEVTSYLVAIIVLGYYAYAHLRRQQWLALAATGRTSMLEAKPKLAAGLVLAYIAVGFWIGSSAVFALGLALILLVVHGDSENPPLHWIALGVLLMLYSAWFWLADITQAVTGMVPFLAPWLLSPEDENEMVAVLLPLEDTSARTRAARSVPWYGGTAFLLLTWLLLTVEIDGSSLEAHEFYGAPLIGLLAIALTLYAWGHSIDASRGTALVAAALVT